MEQYERGDTIRIIATFRDLEGNLVDPTSPQYSVYQPDGTIYLQDQNMTKDAVGEYHFDVPTSLNADIGYWEIELWGYYGSNRILDREKVRIVTTK